MDEINEGTRAIFQWTLAFIGACIIGGFLYFSVLPSWENSRRDAYEHTESYVQGAVRDLSNLCLEVEKASNSHRTLLQDTIRERYTKLDTRDVPAYLQSCLQAARKGE